jgi:hypothetical protein
MIKTNCLKNREIRQHSKWKKLIKKQTSGSNNIQLTGVLIKIGTKDRKR